MVDWSLTDEGTVLFPIAGLPRHAQLDGVVPPDSWHLLLQWNSQVSTSVKQDILRRLAPSGGAILHRSDAPPTSYRAVDSFIDSVDSDQWWLGDMALLATAAAQSMLLFPSSDGAFLDIFGWGAEKDQLKEIVIDSLAWIAPLTGPS